MYIIFEEEALKRRLAKKVNRSCAHGGLGGFRSKFIGKEELLIRNWYWYWNFPRNLKLGVIGRVINLLGRNGFT